MAHRTKPSATRQGKRSRPESFAVALAGGSVSASSGDSLCGCECATGIGLDDDDGDNHGLEDAVGVDGASRAVPQPNDAAASTSTPANTRLGQLPSTAR